MVIYNKFYVNNICHNVKCDSIYNQSGRILRKIINFGSALNTFIASLSPSKYLTVNLRYHIGNGQLISSRAKLNMPIASSATLTTQSRL